MLLSAGCEYAIQALLYLESIEQDELKTVVSIAKETSIPPSFLAKIVQRLVAEGVLVSGKGPGGGVALARPAAEITLLDIVQAIDGLGFKSQCVLGFPDCNDKVPCPVHSYWGELREDIAYMFAAKSLKDFASEITPAVRRRLRTGRNKR